MADTVRLYDKVVCIAFIVFCVACLLGLLIAYCLLVVDVQMSTSDPKPLLYNPPGEFIVDKKYFRL